MGFSRLFCRVVREANIRDKNMATAARYVLPDVKRSGTFGRMCLLVALKCDLHCVKQSYHFFRRKSMGQNI